MHSTIIGCLFFYFTEIHCSGNHTYNLTCTLYMISALKKTNIFNLFIINEKNSAQDWLKQVW